MSTEEKFIVRIHLVVLATDIANGKQFILSLKEDIMELPTVTVSDKILTNLELNLVKHLQSLVFANELELLPQLISINTKFLDSKPGEINCVYGFVLKKTDSINNSFWIEFSYGESTKYSNLIIETIHKLK